MMLKLRGSQVAIPRLPWRDGPASAFLLSSHRRAREAIELALAIDAAGYNVFVLGEDRTGRMTTTMSYLRAARGAPGIAADWVYLNNFQDDSAPRAFRLSAGDGRRLAESIDKFLDRIRRMLDAALTSDEHRQRVDALYREVEARRALSRDRRQTRDRAGTHAAPRGRVAERRRRPRTTEREPSDLSAEELEREIAELRASADEQRAALNRQTLATILDGEFPPLTEGFAAYPELGAWLAELRDDLLKHVDLLTRAGGEDEEARSLERYRVNLFVEGAPAEEGVVLEANPTYENLFGRIEYRRIDGIAETDFLLIRPGALHRANGGVLVLRADALTKDESAWRFLKAALRDGEIRIEELHRVGAMPITGLPKPQPIPLRVKVVIVGSRDTYFRFFSDDPEFHTYFKVKADIDADMEASEGNVSHLGSLISSMAAAHGLVCDREAVSLLLGLAARFAGRRDLMTARFELLEDLLCEAAQFAVTPGRITPAAIYAAWQAQLRRNSRAEQRFFDSIRRGHISITTKGAALGQVNALTVRDLGEHRFGRPSRVTARVAIGRRGVINIERVADLGGRVQQKGALVVEGYLRGVFGQRHPISFDGSVTFEQNYGGIDGDSASVAELLAILSSLAEIPLRQDLAVTGSFNQHGEVQAVGDLIEKIEGFFRATEVERLAGLRHGVVLPQANIGDLVLDDDVAAAVDAGVFNIWVIERVEEAVDLLCMTDRSNQRPSQTVYEQAAATLARYDSILWEREVRLRTGAMM
jgi:predicted ATP-dependent protease